MIKWQSSLEDQFKRYSEVKVKLNSGFYQELKFYVLPFMPEKFRSRVVFFPEDCEPEKIYKKHKFRLEKLHSTWNSSKASFLEKVKKIFPEINTLEITISPSLYGSIGTYKLKNGIILLNPRYDRNLESVQKLLITALTHYFHFGYKKKLNSSSKEFTKKQEMAAKFQVQIVESKKHKPMLQILDSNFAGDLAEKSIEYLKKLNIDKASPSQSPKNLTKEEQLLFKLLSDNKNKVVSFEEIANALWEEKSYDKYSEYAITKLVERLKKKLPKNLIHSQRGQGYLLYF